MELEYYHHNGVGLRVRRGIMNEWDKIITRESQEHYTFEGLDYRQQRTILDIGANIGSFSLYALSLNPDAEVVAVEIENDNAAICQHNLAGIATAYHAHLGYEQGDLILAKNPHISGSHRVINRVAGTPLDNIQYQDISAPSLTLEAIFDKHEWQQLDLLKLDCEARNTTLSLALILIH